MARTKQTARKNTGGKPLAMGRGKATPKKNPTPGRSADRKVVLEYSSDEDRQPAEGAGAPKRVKKQIHLTLPTSPAHVTTTESFTAFFINHGLTRALQKAFAKRGWSTDQMREFVTNFQKKHGQQVPMPKIYGDEDSSESEGLELADGTKVGKKTTGGAGGSGGGKPRKKPAASGRSGEAEEQAVVTAPVQVVQAVLEAKSEVVMMTVMMMTPTSAERPVKVHHQSQWWPAKSHARRPQVTLRLTGSCQSSTSLARKREPRWATAYWIGLMSRRGRSTRHECRGGW